ncbi:hypothetical protein SFRURICE_014867 [Spodoptera frugiperda]|uniref:SFRICE_030156 n=1 Tax=Spodoptera frugiperda TaxID=7108 RepID=A0A2H1WAB9_SPOFR|nr:hypothetical protein SFRURICE_014867 [Spodoptera frugiperda]
MIHKLLFSSGPGLDCTVGAVAGQLAAVQRVAERVQTKEAVLRDCPKAPRLHGGITKRANFSTALSWSLPLLRDIVSSVIKLTEPALLQCPQ